jgi:TolB protein
VKEMIEKKRFFVFFAVFYLLLCCTGGSLLSAKVYIDIDSPGYRPLPVALFILPPPSEADACRNPQAEQTLVDVLKRDLEVSGFFRILPSELYLVNPREISLYPAKIDYHAWSLIGAEALLLIQLSCSGEKVSCEAQLLDVLTGKLLTWKRYKSTVVGSRKVAHKFANEVEKALTGVDGAFDTKIAYISNAGGSKEVYLMDYDGHGPRQTTHLNCINLSPAWAPDGAHLAFTSYWKGSPQIYRIDLKAPDGLKPLVREFSPLTSGAAWSPDGERIAFSASRKGKTNLFNIPSGGGEPEQLTKSWSIDVSPSWSPEGKQVVFVSGRSGHPDLYIMRADGEGTRRLTFKGSYNADPEWSPRGDWIVYVSQENGRFQIFRIRPDGTQRTQLTRADCDHLNPTWSPNGRLIAFSSDQEGSFDLYLIRMDGTGRRRLSWGPRDETEPAWSPRLNR